MAAWLFSSAITKGEKEICVRSRRLIFSLYVLSLISKSFCKGESILVEHGIVTKKEYTRQLIKVHLILNVPVKGLQRFRIVILHFHPV